MTEQHFQRSTSKALSKTMKTQIVSMLKGVISDNNSEDDSLSDDFECIFGEENDDDKESTTLSKSNTSSMNNFSRDMSVKSNTAKCMNCRLNQNFPQNYFYTRKESKKFLTTQGTFSQNQVFNQTIPNQKFYGYSMANRINSELESMLVKSNKFDMEIYNYLKGNFVNLIKNQQTSRLCQFYFDQTPYSVIHLIFLELCEHLPKLLLDPYANYFCLKLFYFLNQKDRLDFLKSFSYSFGILATNKISTYPIQCILEHLTTDAEKDIIISSIPNSFLISLCLDVYGTHVIEKVIAYSKYEKVKHIFKFIIDNFMLLANNANGLCVVKKMIIAVNSPEKEDFEKIKQIIFFNSLVLIQNPYGNYALQAAIDNWDLSHTEFFMENFINKCSVLSLQKYSSNVIERCIEKSNNFYIKFMNEILKDNCYGIGLLLQNSYGNYVIQTALKISSEYKLQLIRGIESNLNKITDRKILMKWRSILY